MFSLYTLLYSIMCLSNATKNQKDVFSRHMQSYVSQSTTFISKAYATHTKCTTNLHPESTEHTPPQRVLCPNSAQLSTQSSHPIDDPVHSHTQSNQFPLKHIFDDPESSPVNWLPISVESSREINSHVSCGIPNGEKNSGKCSQKCSR